MKKLETSMRPSSNPLIGPNARLDGPVFGGNSMTDFTRANPESASNSSQANSERHILLKMVYEGHSILDEVEAANKKRYAIERASHAGSAKKSDALQCLIESMVSRNPSMSAKELYSALWSQDHREFYGGIILSINDLTIEFKNGKNQRSEMLVKSASVSGLKDRLSRAKKKIAQTS